jgi:hypothetical protein
MSQHNQHRLKSQPRMIIPTSTPNLKNSGESLQDVESIAESLKAELPNFTASLPGSEREALTNLTGTTDRSNGRLTAKEKRIIGVQKSAEEFYLTISMILASIPSFKADGVAVAMQTVSMSEAHVSCCRKNEAYLEFMEKMFSASSFMALAASHLTLIAMIAHNHNVNLFGFLPWVETKELPPEQKQPEMSEEQRAMIFMGLMSRQQQFESQLNGDIT